MKQAWVFPGQGSQSVGMLGEFAQHPIVKDLFSRAQSVLGYDLEAMIQQGPAEALNQTAVTQPAILATSYAFYQIYQAEKQGPKPALLAGHSLGEYTAYLIGGAFSFETALRLVATRGELMQSAVPAGQGAMAAILGLEDELVTHVCQETAQQLGKVVSAVNFNAPGQVVIAGETQAVEQAIIALKAVGAKRALPLPVSVPSHCDLMKPAALKFKEALQAASIQLPHIPVISNVDVTIKETSEEIIESLYQQLFSPVLWTQTVQAFQGLGANEGVECGPGKVLSGLSKRIAEGLPMLHVLDLIKAEGLNAV